MQGLRVHFSLFFHRTIRVRFPIASLVAALMVMAIQQIQAWAAAPAPEGGQRHVHVYLQLEGEPVAVVAMEQNRVATAALGSPALRRAAEIRAQQDALVPQINAAGGIVLARLTRLVNAIKVRAYPEQLDALRALPGVRSVRIAVQYSQNLTHSIPTVHAPQAWSRFLPGGLDGRGIRMGIIDSGIDYTHADFGGSGNWQDFEKIDRTRVEAGVFPTTKVVGGYDFAGDDYDAGSEDFSVPKPDPNPLDCRGIGHGTHVAGIAAGFGVLTNGASFAGPYRAETDMNQFSIGPGVAPRASLYAVRIFGCSGTTDLVAEGLEYAADPNGDYDFSDRLDVVNLSLGISFSSFDPEDTDNAAANMLARLGCVVVSSAGNAGNIFYAVGGLSAADRVISVANSIGYADGLGLKATAAGSFAATYFMVEGDFTKPLASSGPITGKLVYANPPNGCNALLNGAELKGNIALMDRGDCFFTNKITLAQAAGAIAVVMVDNIQEVPITMSGTGPSVGIPGVMISLDDGAVLKSQLSNNVQVVLDASNSAVKRSLVDTLDDSSSRGPGTFANSLKPDISAPGYRVFSAKAGSGMDGVKYTGTSMSSPVIAGGAALLKQLHPDWSVEDIKAALLNASTPIGDAKGRAYPASRSGAGRVDLERATALQVTAAAAGSNGSVGLSFGAIIAASPFTETRMVTLRNHGTNSATFSASVSNTVVQAGVTFDLPTNAFTLAGNGSVSIPIRVTADPDKMKPAADPTTEVKSLASGSQPLHALYEASGQIWFTATNQTLQLPFYANVRLASGFSAATNYVLLATNLSTQRVVDYSISFVGNSSLTNPVMSGFQLVFKSPTKNPSNASRATTDIVAAGYATDIATAGSLANARLYFAIVTARPWTTPQPFSAEFDVLIDVDGDGEEDFALYNDNGTVTNSASSITLLEDAFVTAFQPIVNHVPTSTTSAGFLNVYGADKMDTAVFNNNVMVLSVPARRLGFGTGATSFYFRVESFSQFGLVDRTSWYRCTPSETVLDPVVFKSDHTPFFTDGGPMRFRLNREFAQKQGTRIPAALILNHSGDISNRYSIVQFDLANDDTDHDLIPDWWEIQNYGNLSTVGRTADLDGDGATDLQEYLAGTDPSNATSIFKMKLPVRTGDNTVVLQWTSVAGQVYTLERSRDLSKGFTEIIMDEIDATPPLNNGVDANAPSSGTYFYRVRRKH